MAARRSDASVEVKAASANRPRTYGSPWCTIEHCSPRSSSRRLTSAAFPAVTVVPLKNSTPDRSGTVSRLRKARSISASVG